MTEPWAAADPGTPGDPAPADDHHDGPPAEAELPDVPAGAGDGPVAAAVSRLDTLGELPPAEHVEVYEDVHRVLQDALADAAEDREAPSESSAGDGTGAP